MSIVGQKRFGPGDFSVGLVNEALAMLSKFGFSPEMLKRIVDLKSGMAEKVVRLFLPEFVIFKTITLGVYGSARAYREALDKAGFEVFKWASDILKKIQVSQSQVQLDLVVLSVAELGFKKAVQLDQIYARAKELGLELCSPEVGPALRLAHPDQSNGEWFNIAMEPISDSGGDLGIFKVVCHDGGLWLCSYCGNPADCLHYSADRFVFVLPRKQ